MMNGDGMPVERDGERGTYDKDEGEPGRSLPPLVRAVALGRVPRDGMIAIRDARSLLYMVRNSNSPPATSSLGSFRAHTLPGSPPWIP